MTAITVGRRPPGGGGVRVADMAEVERRLPQRVRELIADVTDINLKAEREVITIPRGQRPPPGYLAIATDGLGQSACVGPWRYTLNGHELTEDEYMQTNAAFKGSAEAAAAGVLFPDEGGEKETPSNG